tara:strand:- start:538 stop:1173 length:636 start_codon:yes stop_codon:yes gene_type:complete
MGIFARGKQALAISDRSGMSFPYLEMVREWNGALVHFSEFEPKQPQLNPRPVGADPQALFNPRVQRDSTPSLILLGNNPFTTVISGGVTFVNVFSLDHQRKTGDVVRLRGPAAQNASPGSGGADARNLQFFQPIPNIDGVTDIDKADGFTITIGKKNADGSVTTAPNSTPTEILTTPESFFFFTSTDTATTGGILGGGQACSAGPVTLKAL